MPLKDVLINLLRFPLKIKDPGLNEINTNLSSSQHALGTSEGNEGKAMNTYWCIRPVWTSTQQN